MIYIQHRVNEVSQLAKLDPSYGCEIDLRSDLNNNKDLYLSHDPFCRGESLTHWLQAYVRMQIQGPVILNTKEDGLEDLCIEILRDMNIRDFFFLDTALPTLVRRTLKNNEKHYAVRLSSFEPLEFSRLFRNKTEWLWADCFFGTQLPAPMLKSLSEDFKICLVSPELQTGAVDQIPLFANSMGSCIQAVCTKRPDLWIETLERKTLRP